MLAVERVEPERFLTNWARDKDVSPHVRNLMGFLALAELAGAVKACPQGRGSFPAMAHAISIPTSFTMLPSRF
jgi:hypothetical protein